jgi:hypothetical protein
MASGIREYFQHVTITTAMVIENLLLRWSLASSSLKELQLKIPVRMS